MIKVELRQKDTGLTELVELDNKTYTVQCLTNNVENSTVINIIRPQFDLDQDPDANLIAIYNKAREFGLANLEVKVYKNAVLLAYFTTLTSFNYNIDPTEHRSTAVSEEVLTFVSFN